jgi:hypothetical protein
VPGTTPTAYERDPGLAAEPVVDQGSYERDAVEDVRPSGGSIFDEGPPPDDRSAFATEDPAAFGAGDARSDAPATSTGEEETQRLDRPGGGGSLFTDEEPERLDRPSPQEPGVQEGIYDQEADQARQQRPSDGL